MKDGGKGGLDKVTHCSAGALVADMASPVACMAGVTQAASLAAGFGLSIVAGVAKELIDERFEWKDLLATAMGGAAATVGLIILYVV